MENIGSITTLLIIALIILTIYLGVKVVPQSKVFVVERVEDWIKIRLQNGSMGWIPSTSVQSISFYEE